MSRSCLCGVFSDKTSGSFLCYVTFKYECTQSFSTQRQRSNKHITVALYLLICIISILLGVLICKVTCRSPAKNKVWDSPHSQSHPFTSDDGFLRQTWDDCCMCLYLHWCRPTTSSSAHVCDVLEVYFVRVAVALTLICQVHPHSAVV